MASHMCSIAYLAWWDKILPQASIEQSSLPTHENLVIILLRASGALSLHNIGVKLKKGAEPFPVPKMFLVFALQNSHSFDAARVQPRCVVPDISIIAMSGIFE